jgi:hypothetical protein
VNIEQAIKLLDEATATIQANRQVHIQIQLALQVVRKYVADNKPTGTQDNGE